MSYFLVGWLWYPTIMMHQNSFVIKLENNHYIGLIGRHKVLPIDQLSPDKFLIFTNHPARRLFFIEMYVYSNYWYFYS